MQKPCQKKNPPDIMAGGIDRIGWSRGYFSPFSILAFNSARASMSPNVVLAAMFSIYGVSSFLGRAFFLAAAAAAFFSSRAGSSKVRL